MTGRPGGGEAPGGQRIRTTLVKICGITRPEDARTAVAAGADMLGLNFWPTSKRFIDGERGRVIAAAAREEAMAQGRAVELVGVFVNESIDEMARIAETVGLDRVQPHGDETAAFCSQLARRGLAMIKALAMAGPEDVARMAHYPCDVFLIDTPTAGYGGSGRTFDWSLAQSALAAAGRSGWRVFLAGGLNPENVADAVRQIRPHGVDTASGVESSPGIKDPDRVRAFVSRAKAAAGV